jgi:uncharacterized protein (DUF1800 family)
MLIAFPGSAGASDWRDLLGVSAVEAPSLIEEIRFGYGPRAGASLSAGGLVPERVLAQLTAPDPGAEMWNRPPLALRVALLDQSKAEKQAEDFAKGKLGAPFPVKPVDLAQKLDPAKAAVAAAQAPAIATPPAMDKAPEMAMSATAPDMTKPADMTKSPDVPAAPKPGPDSPAANLGKQLKAMQLGDINAYIGRAATTSVGFVERLVNMWSNRISVSNDSNNLGNYLQAYLDEAIRPNIAGRYADMLKAAIWHPAMQIYLTQTDSIGPKSVAGLARGKGLNENLAREFLELHSMGHGYTQTDVTEFARLLAGMANDDAGPHVNMRRVEPGKKTILGRTYTVGVPEINRLVEDVAHRPETADAVGFFVARHFISDVPPPDLVQALSAAYLAHDTQLVPVYRTLLQHPSASDPVMQKVRSPHEYAVASLRLMGLTGMEENMVGFDKGLMQVPGAMARMGQLPFRALRPDGWPEVADGWMTPPMAARVDWAIDLARATGDRADPTALATFALGDTATPLLQRAVAGAEQRWEGLAVLFASPEFSRR